MKLVKKVLHGLMALAIIGSVEASYADTALFNAPGTYDTGAYIGIDTTTGLRADAVSVPDARGVWNVWSNVTDHLAVANNTDPLNPGGATFSLPGRTFDLDALKVFGYRTLNPRLAGATLAYTILGYYPGNPVPVAVPFTIKSLAAPVTKVFSTDFRLKGLEKAVIQFGSTSGLTYFIETKYTPH